MQFGFPPAMGKLNPCHWEGADADWLVTAVPATSPSPSLLSPGALGLQDPELSTWCGCSLTPLCQPSRFQGFGMWDEFAFLTLPERNKEIFIPHHWRTLGIEPCRSEAVSETAPDLSRSRCLFISWTGK